MHGRDQCGDVIGAHVGRHSMPEVEDARLDFPTNLRMGKNNVFAQCAYFPPEFIKAAGLLGIGVELTIYPTAGGDDDTENAGAA